MSALLEALERDLEAIAKKRFITAMEAALISDRHPETVRDAARAGDLHGAQRLGEDGQPLKGARWRFRPACVDAWVCGELCEHRMAERPVSLSEYRLRASRGAR